MQPTWWSSIGNQLCPEPYFQKCVHVMVCAKMNNQWCPSFIWLAMIAAMVTVPPPEGLQEQKCRFAGGFPSQLLGTPGFKEPQTPKPCVIEEPSYQQRDLCVLHGYKCTVRVFICKQNNVIDFCCISGDRKEETSAKHFVQAAAASAHRVSKDSSVPLLPIADLWADPHGDKGVTPDMPQTRGQPLGNSGSAGKAKQAGVKLFYRARASPRLCSNKYKGDCWRVKKPLTLPCVKTSIKTTQKPDVCLCLVLEKNLAHIPNKEERLSSPSQDSFWNPKSLLRERSPKVWWGQL